MRTLLSSVAAVLALVLSVAAFPRAVHAAPDDRYLLGGFVLSEAAFGGDLNADGDTTDSVVHVVNAATGITINLGLAAPLVCEASLGPLPWCRPVPPVAGDSIVAFLVSERDQGGLDLNGDGDAFDAVLFVYDARSGTVTPTGLAAAHGTTRSISFITFPIVPVVIGNVVVFLAGEAEQGGTDLNADGDVADDVFHVLTGKSYRSVNLGLAAPIGSFFGTPILAAELHHQSLVVLIGEGPQGETDLNRDGDADDAVLMIANIHSGHSRLPK